MTCEAVALLYFLSAPLFTLVFHLFYRKFAATCHKALN